MFESTSNGWQLVRQSWRVLKLDKELLVFPLLSGVACLLVTVSFAVPLLALVESSEVAEEHVEQAEAMGPEQVDAASVLYYAGALAYYVANYFVIVFFNSALIACAIIRFKGGDPTLKDGFSAAFSRLPQIFCWALVAGTVGLLLRVVESKSDRVGRIITSLLGMAWSAVTYFVVPVIVVEKLGPLAAGQRSLQILRKTWGQSLTANFGIGCIVGLLMILAVIPVVVGLALTVGGSAPVGIPVLIAGLFMLLMISLVSSALNSIVLGALYLYAAEGQVPDQFDDQMFQGAFGNA